jgi:hypothetical protein
MMAIKKRTDLGAALTGFILGAVTLFLLLTSIVLLTNAKYRNGEEGVTTGRSH